jgi:hypothetical protein
MLARRRRVRLLVCEACAACWLQPPKPLAATRRGEWVPRDQCASDFARCSCAGAVHSSHCSKYSARRAPWQWEGAAAYSPTTFTKIIWLFRPYHGRHRGLAPPRVVALGPVSRVSSRVCVGPRALRSCVAGSRAVLVKNVSTAYLRHSNGNTMVYPVRCTLWPWVLYAAPIFPFRGYKCEVPQARNPNTRALWCDINRKRKSAKPPNSAV